MPKFKRIESDRYRRFIREFDKDVLKVDGHVLFCIPCNKEISAEKKSQVYLCCIV